MSKHNKDLWLSFGAGFVVALGFHVVEIAREYPALPTELAHHCASNPGFHPDCADHKTK